VTPPEATAPVSRRVPTRQNAARSRGDRFSLDDTCTRCRSLLYSPQLALGMEIPVTADYVCLNCGRAYKREGNPPTLNVVALATAHDDEDDYAA
jgi:hypothetical protein